MSGGLEVDYVMSYVEMAMSTTLDFEDPTYHVYTLMILQKQPSLWHHYHP